MHRTPLRIGILVVGLLVTAGLGFRVFQDEQSLNNARQAAVSSETAVNDIDEALIDLRASLHAYVAPGQGLPFWAKRAQGTIDTLRDRLKALDATIAPSGGSLAESLDDVDQLTAAERRARTYVSRGENELAADVIFTEIRDLLAAMSSQIDAVGTTLKADADRRLATARNEQLMLAAAAFGLWVLIAIALVPVPQVASKDPAEWRNELKAKIEKPIAVTPSPAVIVDAVDLSTSVPTVAPESELSVALGSAPSVPSAALASTPSEPSVALESVARVAEICADLSALSDPTALDGALARVTQLLDATGLIIWVASNDNTTLAPVATHGFDPKLVARIGRIARDSANLTASAFRDNIPKMSAATETAPAAMAIALCGPTGPAGVLSIELKAGQAVDDGKVALASIVAAQLATLAMPVAEAPEAQIELEPQHRAAV